jgi:hypothetical protein
MLRGRVSQSGRSLSYNCCSASQNLFRAALCSEPKNEQQDYVEEQQLYEVSKIYTQH